MAENRAGPGSKARDCDAFGASTAAELDAWLKQRESTLEWEELWHELLDEREPLIGPDGELILNERGQAKVRRRWTWNQAAFIAWSCVPKDKRDPKSLHELARLLGVSSPGTFRNWRRRKPHILDRIKALPKQMLIQHVPDVYAAMVAVATMPDPRATAERRLFLEIVEEYMPGSRVDAELTVRDDDARQRLARLLGEEPAEGAEGGGDRAAEQ